MDRISQLEELLLATPKDSFLIHALALEHMKLQDWARAERYFLKNLEASPDYVATYYHYGGLLEGRGKEEAAASIYLEGMEKAKLCNDLHSFSELRSAYEELTF